MNELGATMGLVAALFHGYSRWQIEGLRLRVTNLDFQRRGISVRGGSGGEDRVPVRPENLILPRLQQLSCAKAIHDRALGGGFEAAWLPSALAVKYPRAPRAWVWQWVFPSASRSTDPRASGVRRQHLNQASVQKAVAGAGWRARLVESCSPHGALVRLRGAPAAVLRRHSSRSGTT